MKVCPVCDLKFEEKTQFCPKCGAQLRQLPEENKTEESKKIPKSFWYFLLGAFAFILFIMFITNVIFSA